MTRHPPPARAFAAARKRGSRPLARALLIAAGLAGPGAEALAQPEVAAPPDAAQREGAAQPRAAAQPGVAGRRHAAAHPDRPGGPGARPSPIGAARYELFAENPWLIEQLGRGGGFGNRFSRAIANRMYSRSDQAAIADARNMLEIVPVGERAWVLRFPIVNVAVFETDAGLVLVDSGYAPAGPPLVEALARLGDRPVHTVILTHFHVDHALGAWALLEAGHTPEIIASDEFIVQQQRDIDLSSYATRRNHQNPADAPRDWNDVVRPTRTFAGRLELDIGGERFVLQAARAETADQLYVYLPGRRIVVTADYYQRFIPNAGNGRRPQRFVDEWAGALEDMAALKPAVMIPMHGPVIGDTAEIVDRLTAHAGILRAISAQVRDGLNDGLAEYEIAHEVALPPAYAARDDVDQSYVSVGDIARMVLHQHTGWWDDIPSHWDAAPMRAQAVEIAGLAGGPAALAARAGRMAAEGRLRMASHFVDWAWLAAPDDTRVLQHAYDIYLLRLRGGEPVQEALAYVDHLVRLRVMLNAARAAQAGTRNPGSDTAPSAAGRRAQAPALN